MAFNVNEFRAKTRQYGGITRNSKFLVNITPPKWLLDISQDDSADLITAGDLRFFCDTVNLPGMSLQTIENKPQGFGKTLRLPTGLNFGTLQTTFYSDSDFRILKFFHQWKQEIINYMGMYYGELNSFKNRTSFEMAYMEDYAVPLQIQTFSSENNESLIEYNIIEAFPIQIGEIQMGWEQNDTLMKIPVEFTFSSFNTRLEKLPIEITSGEGRGVNLFERIAQLGGIAGVISNVSRPRNIQDLINQTVRVSTLLRNI